MNCPKCGTWNPDDKRVCWRCQTELPKPVEKKKARAPAVFLGLPTWAWVMLGALLVFWVATQCLAPAMIGGR
jgi:predicted nucleic acid-binding Zn ribbon protein